MGSVAAGSSHLRLIAPIEKTERSLVTLEPLWQADRVVVAHAAMAVAALGLGAVQLAAPKGTMPHRMIGYVWAGLLMLVAASSFFIHQIRQVGPFSWIHVLSAYTLVAVPLAVRAARRHEVRNHMWWMIGLFFGALVVTGAFTLTPYRLMNAVVFGD